MKSFVNILFLLSITFHSWTQASFEEGNKAYLDAKYDDALSIYEKVVEIDQTNVSAMYNLGMTHIQLKNYGDAIWAFESVLKLNPSDKQAEEQIFYAYTELGAINEWQHILGPFEKALFSISSKSWALFSVIFSVLFSALFILNLVKKNLIQQKYILLFCSSFLMLMILTGFISYKAQTFETGSKYAIVTSSKIDSFLNEKLTSKGPELTIGNRLQILREDTASKILEVIDVNDNLYFVHLEDIKAI